MKLTLLLALISDIALFAGTGLVSTVAGNGTQGYGGIGGPATSAQLNTPAGVLFDPSGNLYIADYNNAYVVKVDAITGILTLVAGAGPFASTGDGGPAPLATLNGPMGLAMDAVGNLYISEYFGNRVRRVDAQTGIITTYAGTGSATETGDGGLATAAGVQGPRGLAVDSSGNLYIAEAGDVRRVDAATGIITTAVVNGTGGVRGPTWLAVDRSGNLLIADQAVSLILRLNLTTNVLDTFAGNSNGLFDGDGNPARDTGISLINGIAVDPSNNVYVASGNIYMSYMNQNRLRRIDGATGIVETVAGTGSAATQSPDGLAANVTPITPLSVAIGPDGNVVFVDSVRVRLVSLPSPWAYTAASLRLSTNYPTPGQNITFTATVVPTTGSGTPTGTVNFQDFTSGQTITSAPLAGGVATLTIPGPNSGTFHLAASYTGDSMFAASLSPDTILTVGGAPGTTSLMLSSSANPSQFGDPLSFGVSLSVPPSSTYMPTGTVQVTDAGVVVFSGAISGIGIGFSLSLGVGTHPLTASYSGDTHYLGSSSPVLSQVILPAGPRNTTVAISSSPNPATLGGPLTLTATVSPAGATGTVEFDEYVAPAMLSWGSATLVNGTATVTIPSLPNFMAGGHTIQANYGGDANNKSSSSASLSQQVVKRTATVSLTSSMNPAMAATPFNITATVAPASGFTGQPTGSVQLLDGATTLGTADLTNGAAQLQVSIATAGAHSITAVYSGDAGFAGVTSPALNEVVKNQALFSATAAPSPSIAGSAVTFSVVMSPSSATGTVEFVDGVPAPGTSLGVAPLVNGAASFTTSSIPAGTHTIGINYSGDANFMSGSSSIPLVVKTASTTALTAAPTAAVYGQAVLLTATVAPGAAPGSVQFTDGSTPLGTVPLNGGTAVLSVTSFTADTHSISATYSGDASNAGSTSSVVSVTVTKATATITVSSALNPAPSGQAITFTIALTPANATGTVQLLDGASVIATLSGGATTASITLAAGQHSVTAAYSGDSNFNGATSAPVSQLVTTATSTTVSAAPATSTYGQAVNLTATVTPAPAGGTVQFLDGATVLGTAPAGSGTAALSVYTFSVGVHAITAVYGGDGAGYLGSTSAVSTETVGKAATTATIAASPNPVAAGQAVTLSATVSPASATGTMQFLDGATILGTVAVSNGAAALSTSALAAGSHALTVAYSGDASDAASTSAIVTVSVVKTATAATLTSSQNPSVAGQAVTFTAQVSPSGATGTIQFKDGSTVLGTVAMSSGAAALTVSTLPVGSHSVTAIYSGDANYTGSTSNAVTQTVTSALPGAPGNLTATSASSSQINLAWTASPTSGATYNVYSSTTSGFTPSSGNRIAAGITATSYAHTGLGAATVHYYVVTAQNSAGESARSNQAGATTLASGASCKVVYTVTTQWNAGFGTAITIKNTGSTPINGWNLTWKWAGNQQITQAWNSNYTQNGKNASLTNASWNPTIAPGATLSGMGFNGSYNGTNTSPTAFYVNGTLCQ